MLGRFFSGRGLTSLPSNRSKRLLGRVRYQEREVNFSLQMFYPDYATLRRYLVDEGLLTRADGVYWRTGGRVSGPDEPA